MCETVSRCEPFPKIAHHSTRQNGRPLHRDLLTENRPCRELKTIPASRYAKPRTAIDLWCQHRIGSQTLHDGRPICIQVEHGADSLGNKEEGAGIAKLQPHDEHVAVFIE